MFPQSDSVQWGKLIKPHQHIEYVDSYYVDKNNPWTYNRHSIYIDTLAIIDSIKLDSNPSPVVGISKVHELIAYPEIGKRAILEGDVILSIMIDTLGNAKDMVLLKAAHAMFNETAINSLKNIKFNPGIKNGKPVEVRIAFPISFVINRKLNVPIDTLIFRKSACLGTCPSYTITLCSSGDVYYEGRYYVAKLGHWSSKIKPYDFEGIVSLIYAVNFFSLDNIYDSGKSDQSSVSITCITKERTKRVGSDYYRPLWEITSLVDKLTEKLEWQLISE